MVASVAQEAVKPQGYLPRIVDARVERYLRVFGAFEIKTGETKVPEAVENLKRLRRKLCENLSSRTRPPEFMAVLTGVSSYARRVEEGIYAIPIRSLTA